MGGVCGISSTTVEILNQYLTLRGSETETKSTTVEILNQYLTEYLTALKTLSTTVEILNQYLTLGALYNVLNLQQ